MIRILKGFGIWLGTSVFFIAGATGVIQLFLCQNKWIAILGLLLACLALFVAGILFYWMGDLIEADTKKGLRK